MSGAAASTVGVAIQALTVTVGSLGSNDLYGYLSGATGAVSPSTVRGATIQGVYAASSGGDHVNISLTGSLAQSFIKAIVLEKTDGTRIRLLANDASFSSVSPSNWAWSLTPRAWTATGTKSVLVEV